MKFFLDLIFTVGLLVTLLRVGSTDQTLPSNRTRQYRFLSETETQWSNDGQARKQDLNLNGADPRELGGIGKNVQEGNRQE